MPLEFQLEFETRSTISLLAGRTLPLHFGRRDFAVLLCCECAAWAGGHPNRFGPQPGGKDEMKAGTTGIPFDSLPVS
jgi:hypothetical protein